MATRRSDTPPGVTPPGVTAAGVHDPADDNGVNTARTQSLGSALDPDTFSEWIARAVEQGVRPEQALAFIGLGLMGRMRHAGADALADWSEDPEAEDPVDLAGLRQRLEITDLALRTGAPLSTAEVTRLMGARPGAPVVERGGLRARRLARNVWKLSRSGEESDRDTAFRDGFRRRL